ncbi:MAG: DUF192 domain-containing protein [Coriobacteriia bacterium]|nr:DUF192 domain-containing protein [Coriobacteriia bacterium]
MTNITKSRHYDVRVASSHYQRLLGLFAKDVLLGADALLIASCNSIHTFGMRKHIDIAFIDSEGMVIKSIRNLHPNCLVSCSGAKAVLERFSSSDQYWFEQGDRLVLHRN